MKTEWNKTIYNFAYFYEIPRLFYSFGKSKLSFMMQKNRSYLKLTKAKIFHSKVYLLIFIPHGASSLA